MKNENDECLWINIFEKYIKKEKHHAIKIILFPRSVRKKKNALFVKIRGAKRVHCRVQERLQAVKMPCYCLAATCTDWGKPRHCGA